VRHKLKGELLNKKQPEPNEFENSQLLQMAKDTKIKRLILKKAYLERKLSLLSYILLKYKDKTIRDSAHCLH
jgi:hypothetical protein